MTKFHEKEQGYKPGPGAYNDLSAMKKYVAKANNSKAVFAKPHTIEEKVLGNLGHRSTEDLHEFRKNGPGPADYTPIKAMKVESHKASGNKIGFSKDESERCMFVTGRFPHSPHKLMGKVPGPADHKTRD